MNIVVIGGGTGSTVVLEGLKNYRDLNLSVIVSMMDDGGSNAVVRDEFGLLPLSDVRKSIIALSNSDDNEILRKLFTYRFSEGENIKGHTMGNLLMIAMTDIMGSEIEAIKMFENMFGVRGDVIPVTLDKTRLVAEYTDGTKIVGEHEIDEIKEDKKIKKFYLDSKASIYKEAKERILNADYIILGPGDLYTTVISNIIVEGVSDAIKKSRAKLVYITNLMSKIGQTRHRTQKEIIELLEENCKKKMDYVLINNGRIPEEAYKRYIADGENLIIDNVIENKRLQVIREDLVANDPIKKDKGDVLIRSLVRHDSKKLGKILYGIFNHSSLSRFLSSIFSQYID
ncbi:MAG: YvcK family protein [Candidatus Dojkabacteria bacterium]|nr:YvcK family protein [Candidatus Dojkabacteria bacterium]